MEIVGKVCPVMSRPSGPSGHTWNVSYTTLCTRDCAAFREEEILEPESNETFRIQRCAMMPGDSK